MNMRQTGAKNAFFFLLLTLVGSSSLYAAEEKPPAPKDNPMSASSVADEVTSLTKDPHYFDWRRAGYELELGYDYVDEANNFNNDGGHIGLGIPVGGGFAFRFGVRRFNVYGTRSSNLVSRTPFKQPGLTNRYEFFAGGSYALLEGRSFSRLSPMVSDFSHALFIELGAHYHHPNNGWVPKRKDPPDPLPGQDPAKPKIVGELGLRWTVFFPEVFGVFFDVREHAPLAGANGGMVRWTHFSAGVIWVGGYQ